MKIEEAIEIIKKHHPFATKYQTDEECIALQTLISHAQKSKVTRKEIYDILITKLPMTEYLSIPSFKLKELAIELEKLMNGEGKDEI